jgi:hypothetical protein
MTGQNVIGQLLARGVNCMSSLSDCRTLTLALSVLVPQHIQKRVVREIGDAPFQVVTTLQSRLVNMNIGVLSNVCYF